ncbi:MAG: hypothetical protein EXQ89_04640 [Rhodospirillaceae bacterium]|nr:hypothetical protein [Rhodospirillaceae bacterium]
MNSPATDTMYRGLMARMRVWTIFLAAAASAGCVAGLPAPMRDPVSPQAAAPAYRHESVFSTYRPAPDQGLGSWRAANDEMWRLGGHMGHIDDLPAAETAPRPSTTPTIPGERRP